MDPIVFFFDGWMPIARILVVGTLGYAALVLLLRGAGKRTMARMTTFDFVITVTLGAAFGRVLTTREVGLAEAIVAFVVLIVLQFAVTWIRARSPAFGRFIDSAPSLLFYRGRFLHDAMRRERVTESELQTTIRKRGIGSFTEVEAIVLEPDGRYAVIQSDTAGDGAAVEQLLDPARR
jgi:uncharacterized membrane protein YcaP (DUF421 family)